jgi:hypothetical protein
MLCNIYMWYTEYCLRSTLQLLVLGPDALGAGPRLLLLLLPALQVGYQAEADVGGGDHALRRAPPVYQDSTALLLILLLLLLLLNVGF